MKEISLKEFKAVYHPSDNEDWCDPALKTADHAECPGFVLKEVCEQLQEFGLEIVEYKTGGDFWAWKIIDTKEAHVCSNGNKIRAFSSVLCSLCYADPAKI